MGFIATLAVVFLATWFMMEYLNVFSQARPLSLLKLSILPHVLWALLM